MYNLRYKIYNLRLLYAAPYPLTVTNINVNIDNAKGNSVLEYIKF